ncbi:secreted protein, partial [gut metagenome]
MMKCIFPLVLVCLLLCGCGAPAPAIPTEFSAPPATEEASLSSAIFAGRDGSLESYRLPQTDAYALAALDFGLLVLSGQEHTELSLFSWQDFTQQARCQLDFFLDPQVPSFQLCADGISCYDSQTGCILVLDGSLKRIRRISAPEDLVGSPLLSPDR